MARPRIIDREQAFLKAKQLFWKRGYSSTSIRELFEATGLKQSNFYKEFRSKDELFVETLKDYVQTADAKIRKLDEGTPELELIERFMNLSLVEVSDSQRRLGCFVVNTIIEMEGVNDRYHRLAADHMASMQEFFKGKLRGAIKKGQVRDGFTETEIARLPETKSPLNRSAAKIRTLL